MEYFKKEKKNKKKNEKINKEKDLKDNTSNDKVKYFLMIPLEQENFIEIFNKIRQKLEKENPKDFDKNLLYFISKIILVLFII